MNRAGLHLGNWSAGPHEATRGVMSGAEVDAVLAMENVQPHELTWWAEQPYARYTVLRKHFDAGSELAEASRVMDWINGFSEMVSNYLTHEPFRKMYEAGRLGAKLFNEPNMIGRSEGFGTDEEGMRRYNDLFPEAAAFLKDRFPNVQIVGYSMTPGNRDVWFETAPEGVHYWLHGPEAAKPDATAAEIEAARQSCLTRDAQVAMDWFGAHIYTEWLSHWNKDFLGFRFTRMWRFLPQHLVNRTVILEASIADNPTDVLGVTLATPSGKDRRIKDSRLHERMDPKSLSVGQKVGVAATPQEVRADGIDMWLRYLREHFPQIMFVTLWWGRPGDPTWEHHHYTEPDGSWRPCAHVLKAFNLEATGDPMPDPPPEPPPEPAPGEKPPREIVNLLDGVEIVDADVEPGATYWYLQKVEYREADQTGGLHHIFYVEPHSTQAQGQVRNLYTGAVHDVPLEKGESEPAGNFPMYGEPNAYEAWMVGKGTTLSDRVRGLRMEQNHHGSFFLWWLLLTEPDEDLPTKLLRKGEEQQVIQFNPDAALQKRIFADGFVPNSGEFSVTHDGTDYVAQRAEHLDTGEVRVYYAEVGEWGNVQHVVR